jgi:Transglycosylase-like domain
VRLSASAFGNSPFARIGGSRAAQLSGAALALGLMVSSVATAAPVGASEPMKTQLHKLRVCESGNNYHENTGNGYYGAYQFAGSTWHSLGFAGRPDHAKASTQNRAAEKMHHRNGWSAWPSCSRTEHLR